METIEVSNIKLSKDTINDKEDIYYEKIYNISKKQDYYLNKLWFDTKIKNNFSEPDQYLSLSNNLLDYYNSYDYEMKNIIINNKDDYYNEEEKSTYLHPLNKTDDVSVCISNNKRLFYYDNLFRQMVDYCMINGVSEPLTNKFLINPDYKNVIYNLLKIKK